MPKRKEKPELYNFIKKKKQKKRELKPRKKYSQEDVDNAIEATKTGKMSQRGAARCFGVPKSTIGGKLTGQTPQTPVPRTVLSQDEETYLAEWIVFCSQRGEGKTKDELCLQVQTILNARGAKCVFKDNLPGRVWFEKFMKRHPVLQGMKIKESGVKKNRVAFGILKKEITGDDIIDGMDEFRYSVPVENVLNDRTGLTFTAPLGPEPTSFQELHLSCNDDDNDHDDDNGPDVFPSTTTVSSPPGPSWPDGPSSSAQTVTSDVSSSGCSANGNREFDLLTLLQLTIACDWTMTDIFTLRRMMIQKEPPSPDKPNYNKFMDLWNKLVPPPDGDNLPVVKNLGLGVNDSSNVCQWPQFSENSLTKRGRREEEERERKRGDLHYNRDPSQYTHTYIPI